MNETWKKEFRRLMIELVLATDNDMHFGLTQKLEAILEAGEQLRRRESVTATPVMKVNVEPKQLLVLQIAMHSADVSNLAKPWSVYEKWLPRIKEEFYCQGDIERELNLPITFAFDRHNPVPDHIFQLVSDKIFNYILALI
jgi:hypothetical protein